MRHIEKIHKNLLVHLAASLLMMTPLVVYPQIVHVQGQPDADKIIYSDSVLEEVFFDRGMIDSMRTAFYNIPGNSTFALAQAVWLNPGNSGKIITNSEGERVWYLKLRSGDAKSLNIIFSKYKLVDGEKVFVYDKLIQTPRGPFTSQNNMFTGSLAVMPVRGDEIIVEYHMKAPYDNNRLEVGQLAHDYIGITGGEAYAKDIYYGSSQSCNVDINCLSGQNWQTEKNSVVRIIAGGTELGSGFLVNNTRQENIAFVITANHVIRNEQNAINSVYVFRYESSYCEGPDGLTEYSLSGAELMAEDVSTDFSLVRLISFPPITFRPYLAGWDVRGVVPDNTVTIHHPSGDVKKITTDNDSPIIATFQDLYTNGFWKVLRWEEGTTEGGSSGSPLFNEDHRVLGFLTGGEAVCGNSVNDYFARMDVAYDINSDFNGSLKPWLDPARTEVKVLDGRDPYEDIKAGLDTLCNCQGEERYLTEYDFPGTGYTTGFNSDSILMYAEKFLTEPGKELSEIIMEIGDRNLVNNLDSISLYLMSDLDEPGSLIARRSIYIREVLDSTDLSFDFFEPIPLPEVFFVSWHLWYKDKASDEQRQFAVFHGAPVTLSENTAYFKDAVNWYPFYNHPENSSPLNLCVKVLTSDSTLSSLPDTIPGDTEMVKLYPNPAGDWLNIKMMDNIFGETKYSIIDNKGVTVMEGYIYPDGTGSVYQISLSELPAGLYYLTLKNDYSFSSHKLIRK